VRSGGRQHDESTTEAARIERIGAGAEQCERQCVESESERSQRCAEVRTGSEPHECMTRERGRRDEGSEVSHGYGKRNQYDRRVNPVGQHLAVTVIVQQESNCDRGAQEEQREPGQARREHGEESLHSGQRAPRGGREVADSRVAGATPFGRSHGHTRPSADYRARGVC
jgi:hypothetical protein